MDYKTTLIPPKGRAKYGNFIKASDTVASSSSSSGSGSGGSSSNWMMSYPTGTADTPGNWTVAIPKLNAIEDGTSIKIKLSTSGKTSGYNYLDLGIPVDNPTTATGVTTAVTTGETTGETTGSTAQTYPNIVWFKYGEPLHEQYGVNDELMLTYRKDAATITGVTTGSPTSVTSTTLGGWIVEAADNGWFYKTAQNVVTCKYPLASVNDVIAFGSWTGQTGSGGTNITIVDNLNSTATPHTDYALSAYQGKVLNEGKQDVLVSGTNIKTINNISLLGSGNIDIQGGGGTYTAGANINISNQNVIAVTGITSFPGWNSMTSGNVTTALGYTPLSAITSGNVTTALGYTPLSAITSGDVTTALGYTPYDASNPAGYITTAATVQNALNLNGHPEGYFVNTATTQTVGGQKTFTENIIGEKDVVAFGSAEVTGSSWTVVDGLTSTATPHTNYVLAAYQGKVLNDTKQDKLTAGTGIQINGNTISVTGGTGGNYLPTSGGTITGWVRISGSTTQYGTNTRLYFGDSDEIYLVEDQDRHFTIHSTTGLTLDVSEEGDYEYQLKMDEGGNLQFGSPGHMEDVLTTSSITGKQDTLIAGSGIQISGNTISVTGGTGGSQNHLLQIDFTNFENEFTDSDWVLIHTGVITMIEDTSSTDIVRYSVIGTKNVEESDTMAYLQCGDDKAVIWEGYEEYEWNVTTGSWTPNHNQ